MGIPVSFTLYVPAVEQGQSIYCRLDGFLLLYSRKVALFVVNGFGGLILKSVRIELELCEWGFRSFNLLFFLSFFLLGVGS